MDVGGAPHIVEAVAILQALELGFEDVIMGRAEIAAERHTFFGQPAIPEIDVAQTRGGHAVSVQPLGLDDVVGPVALAEQEVPCIGRCRWRGFKTVGCAIGRRVIGKHTDDGAGRRPPGGKGGGFAGV